MIEPVTNFSRLARTLSGDIPRIETVGILSAANPRGASLPAEENIGRNRALRNALATYGVTQIKGSFDAFLNPYIVANIARELLLSLGARFEQERVIFGQRHNKDDNTGMLFTLLATGVEEGSAGAVVAERRVFLAGQQAGSPPSSMGEHLFALPYFDDAAQGEELRGAQVLTYRREEVPGTPQAQEVLNRFLARDRLLKQVLSAQRANPTSTDHYLYQRRGDQNLCLIELHKLMGNWRSFPLFSWEHAW